MLSYSHSQENKIIWKINQNLENEVKKIVEKMVRKKIHEVHLKSLGLALRLLKPVKC